jgi:hypothetical protein
LLLHSRAHAILTRVSGAGAVNGLFRWKLLLSVL